MAGVERIKEKIFQDAELKAAEILEKAKLQAKETIDKANAASVGKAQELSVKAAYNANEKKRIIHSIVELEMRKDLLAAKQEVIEKVFDTAFEELNKMDGSKYENVIFNMLMAAVETGDEEIIMSSAGKSKLSSEFIRKVNSSLEVLGKKGMLSISDETRDISGGFILRRQGVEINNSFEAILRNYRDEIEPKVAEILFQ